MGTAVSMNVNLYTPSFEELGPAKVAVGLYHIGSE